MNLPRIAIADFCQTISGGTPSRSKSDYYGGSIPWVKSGELLDEPLRTTGEHITELALKESSAKIVPTGAVLLAMYGATVGRTALLEIDAATNQAVCALVPNKRVASGRYVWYALRACYSDFLAKRIGGAQPNISQQIIKATKLPVPAPSEQSRIVEILDEADRLRHLSREADAKAARILPALFLKMFGDPATNPHGLRKKPLGELIRVRSGDFLPAKDMTQGGEYPVYGGNGISGYHDSYMFEAPKIVLGRVGAYCGVVHYSSPKAWITDNALYVSDKLKPLDDRYLVAALMQANLNQYAGRAGQPLISGSRIYPINILVPPENLQSHFSRAVMNLLEIDPVRSSASDRLEHTWELLMDRAFSGRLTSKWREAHMKELLEELEVQARVLNLLPVAQEAML